MCVLYLNKIVLNRLIKWINLKIREFENLKMDTWDENKSIIFKLPHYQIFKLIPHRNIYLTHKEN